MIKLLITKLRMLGLKNFMMAGATVSMNLVLQKIYRFDPWHVGGNYYSRPYKVRVIALAADTRPRTVVEIGVGLGDIIGRISAKSRLGLDLDNRVLKAARHLLPRDVKLAVARFQDPESVIEALTKADIKAIDCLILVNWIHMLEIDEIERVLRRVTQSVPIQYIVFDSIKAGIPGYRYHHSAADFARLGKLVEIREGDEVRDLALIGIATRL